MENTHIPQTITEAASEGWTVGRQNGYLVVAARKYGPNNAIHATYINGQLHGALRVRGQNDIERIAL